MITIAAKFTEIYKDGPERELTPQERATVTSVASVGNDYVYYQGDEPAPVDPSLDELKQIAIDIVDAETESNILQGFSFAGHTFSMSTNAQINWSNFPNLPSQVFPLSIMTKNDVEYMLSEANKLNFYMSALGYKNSCLQVGNAKKKAIMACETIEELNAL